MKPDRFNVLMIADPHMCNRLPYAKPTENGLTDRFEDQLRMWNGISTVIAERDIDAVFVLGDLFHRSTVDAVTLTHTVDVITGLNCDVFILPGNHDANNVGGRFVVEAFGKMRNDRVNVIGETDSTTLQVELKNAVLEFWPMAFKPMDQTNRELEAIQAKLNRKHSNILLIHNSIKGAKHLGWTCDDGLESDHVCDGFDRVYAGHFHTPQTFGARGLYVGAPMQHDFGDVGRVPGYLIVEFDSDGNNEEFVKTALPEFHIYDSLDAEVSAEIGDYVRFEIEATHAQWVKLKPKARVVCDELRRTMSVNATFVHKPVSHHKTRMNEDGIDGAIDMNKAIDEYVGAAGVVTKGMSKKTLKKFGRKFLGQVGKE